MNQGKLRRKYEFISAIAVASFMLPLFSPSPALAEISNKTRENKKEIIAAIERIENGTWSQQDIDFIEQFPEVARHVPDPSAQGIEVEIATPTSQGMTAFAQYGGYVVSGFTQKSVIGDDLFNWNHRVDWDFDESTGEVIGQPVQDSWFEDVASNVDVQPGYTEDRVVSRGETDGVESYIAHRTAQVKSQLPIWGDLVIYYPGGEIQVAGDGAYSWLLHEGGDYIDSGGGNLP
ncbi:hypothetical protein [Salinactinospora qingdaonensis]|uniref:LGFP repeat-containing protein n=1 Tax=Salinactinospora qingdaonensis TaxID=702744 RepID=A0ABP7GMR5_9ACTN